MKKTTTTKTANKVNKAAKATPKSKKAATVQPVETATIQPIETAQAQTEQKVLTGIALHFETLREVSEQARKIKDEFAELAKSDNPDEAKFAARAKDYPLNYFILNCVYQGSFTKFKTYNEWQAVGAQVNKGEKAFLIWGKPEITQQPNGSEKVYYPIKYVFSKQQVTFGNAAI